MKDERSQIADLCRRLRQYEGRPFETTICYNGMRDEAAGIIEVLVGRASPSQVAPANPAQVTDAMRDVLARQPELMRALEAIDGEGPCKEPRDDWSSSDLDEAFEEGKVRGRWEMAIIARAALPGPNVEHHTPETLLAALRSGRRMRPTSWATASLLRDGYCHVRNQHVFVEHTPATVGLETSPAIEGARKAVRDYGLAWVDVTAPHLSQFANKSLMVGALTAAIGAGGRAVSYPPDNGLGEPKQVFEDTFSAETVLLDHFFPGAGGQAVAVKPLEWQTIDGDVIARTDIKSYCCRRFGNGFDLLIDGYHTKPYIHGVRETHPTLDEAKAAAQADFERRILSALSQPRPADERTCTCHPDDKPPSPCAEKYALSECRKAADERVVEDERVRRGMEEILKEQSARDIPFAPVSAKEDR